MKKSIFTLEETDNEVIVLKVNCNSPLEAARNPYVDMNTEYVSLTRGKDHILNIVRSDGSSWNFHFGESGHTLVDKSTELLKDKVLSYLHDRHILIDYTGEKFRNAAIFYNDNYDKWVLRLDTVDGKGIGYESNTAVSAEEMIEECKVFVEADKWDLGKAQTGIDIWEADNPVFKVTETEKQAVLEDRNPKTKANKSKEIEKD